ncbi:MAG: helix-turn-helix domain-containing protein [Lachnospira sp.]|nr:helix-turn-helix domain-containing protein [Lachnospira sp.]
MTINEKIFTEIREKSLKKADLARLLQVNTSVIATWEKRGTNPPAEYLVRICEFLNITIYELLGIENENKIQKAYDEADAGTQAAIRKLLDIPEDQDKISYTSKIG